MTQPLARQLVDLGTTGTRPVQLLRDAYSSDRFVARTRQKLHVTACALTPTPTRILILNPKPYTLIGRDGSSM